MSTLDLPESLTLINIQKYVKEQCSKRGWNNRNDLERLVMLTEEVGEVAKEIRRHNGNMGYKKPDSTDALGEELIDVMNFLIDLANSNDIDLDKAFRAKWQSVNKRTWHQSQ